MIAAALVLVVATATADVGVDERPGATLPLDVTFTDPVRGVAPLGDHLLDDRPTLLVLGYARCELLCSVFLRGLAEGARAMTREVGRDLAVVTISLDDTETAEEAAAKQAGLAEAMGRPGEPEAWRYLQGRAEDVARVAAALGVRYRRDAASGQIAHPAVVVVLTPDRRVARYLYAVTFAGPDLDVAVRDAAAGRIAALSTEEAALRCFRFEGTAEALFGALQGYFRAGGLVLALGIGLGLAVLIRRRRTP